MRNSLFVIVLLWQVRICLGQDSTKTVVEFGTIVTGDFVINMNGGIKQGLIYIGKEELTLGIRTENAGLWKNGFLFIHGLNTHGVRPSANMVGDLQIITNIEAGDHTGLFELYYKQQLGKFTFLIGQHDLNSEFLVSKYSSSFINSSFGIMPAVSLNVPVSIYPLTGLGMALKYESDKNFICRLGVYDGDPGNIENNRYNLQWSLTSRDGFFYIAEGEYGLKNGDQKTGSIKVGGYYHSGFFKNYNDSLNFIRGNYGLYTLIDKALFPRSFHAGHGLGFFIQGGITPSISNMVHYYIGGGFRYHGILPNRFKDQLGIAIAHISLSKNYVNYATPSVFTETSIEVYYAFRFGGRYCVQPDMQYVVNPGSDRKNANSLVGLLRFSLTY